MTGSSLVDFMGSVAEIVGERNVILDPARLASYFPTKVEPSTLVAACPATTEEIQRIVELCYASTIPLFTTYDTHFPEDVASQKGILLDFQRMDRIERIDSKNLCVHILRGVTFEQLEESLKPLGLTALLPAAGRTRSVVCHAVSRGMNLAAAKYPDVQVSNMQVVLQNGQVHRTGSHACSEEMADYKDDGGPNVSKWYLGGDDLFGIVVRGSIWVYPRFEGRFHEVFGFREIAEALRLLKELPRLELTAECIVMNSISFARRFQLPNDAAPPWTLIVGVEAFKELALYHRRKIREAVEGAGGSILDSDLEHTVASGMARSWYVQDGTYAGFHTLFKKAPAFERILSTWATKEKVCPESIGKTYIAHGLGRSVYCQYDLPESSNGDSFIEDLELKLVSAGAFFDRPQGKLAEHVYGTIPAYVRHIKRIKAMMDERRIFNPGRPIQEV